MGFPQLENRHLEPWVTTAERDGMKTISRG